MQIEQTSVKTTTSVPVKLDLENTYHIFQQPRNNFTTGDKGRLESFRMDSNEASFLATYRPDYGNYQNSVDLEQHKLKMKGTPIPLRNHLFVIKKTSQGCKLLPVKSLVTFTQVYENESKIHVSQKLDQIKGKGVLEGRLNDLTIL